MLDWLYGADHIKVAYSLQYERVAIEQLSPGTRRIALLLLYLSIDAEDDRPLIFNQPVGNLDQQSVFEDLVICPRRSASVRTRHDPKPLVAEKQIVARRVEALRLSC